MSRRDHGAPQLCRRPRVLVLHAPGTNRDRTVARACTLAGATADIALLQGLISGEIALNAYHMLVLPGGFSYGDDLGAGRLWGIRISDAIGEQLGDFVDAGWPVLGICNGFQALLHLGLLPGGSTDSDVRQPNGATAVQPRPPPLALSENDSGQFECRWVHLVAEVGSPCLFTRDLGSLPVTCPVAHHSGRLVARDQETLRSLESQHQIALRYADSSGLALPFSERSYPLNPNGSIHHIAGICNPQGNVLGLMPHPEDHINSLQTPHHMADGQLGLRLLEAGVKAAARLLADAAAPVTEATRAG